MFDKTLHEILDALFMSDCTRGAASDPRIEVLAEMVCDLLMEVEALRAVVSASKLGLGGKNSVYGRAYSNTAYTTHNSSGPSGGWEKLLALFYTHVAEQNGQSWPGRRTWRECLLLRRLGYSNEEVRAYQKEAEKAETFT